MTFQLSVENVLEAKIHFSDFVRLGTYFQYIKYLQGRLQIVLEGNWTGPVQTSFGPDCPDLHQSPFTKLSDKKLSRDGNQDWFKQDCFWA